MQQVHVGKQPKALVSTHASGSEVHSALHLVASSAHQHARLPMGGWVAGPAHGRHANRKSSSCAGARARHSPYLEKRFCGVATSSAMRGLRPTKRQSSGTYSMLLVQRPLAAPPCSQQHHLLRTLSPPRSTRARACSSKGPQAPDARVVSVRSCPGPGVVILHS